MEINKIGVVCYGNIARSQILGIYLTLFLKEADASVEVFSAGTADYESNAHILELIDHVREKLHERNVDVVPERTGWSDTTKKELETCDVILAADAARKQDLVRRLNVPSEKIYTFYSFIDEGEKDFDDPYDYMHKRQDSERFAKCFDELERIARKVVEKIT